MGLIKSVLLCFVFFSCVFKWIRSNFSHFNHCSSALDYKARERQAESASALRRVDLDNYFAVQGVTLMLMQTAARLMPVVIEVSFFFFY